MSSQSAANFHPTTFLERGVSVPFTAAALLGARARPAEREAIELVIPNPAGGRGAYVIAPSGITTLCRPTIHDMQLIAAIADVPVISPSFIRKAAQSVVGEGFAGRAAAAAAAAAKAAEEATLVVTIFELLLRLVRQTEQAGLAASPSLGANGPAEVERRAKRSLAQLAPKLGRNTDQVVTALEELAGLYVPLGLGDAQDHARMPACMARLAAVRAELVLFAGADDDGSAAVVEMAVGAADITLACAGKALRTARGKVDTLPDLLRGWLANPNAVARELTRVDWLLDGWERVCLIWQAAETGLAQRAALEEIMPLLPMIPKEAGEWVGFSVDMDAPKRTHRTVANREDWRTGTVVLDLIERNERLCAAAA